MSKFHSLAEVLIYRVSENTMALSVNTIKKHKVQDITDPLCRREAPGKRTVLSTPGNDSHSFTDNLSE
jgi:hypothetical protein